MEGDVVADLVKQLVKRILPSQANVSEKSSSNGDHRDTVGERAYQYAMRIIGSRIAPSLASDEVAMAEAIKRQLVLEGRSSDALTFADLHRRFASLSGPGSVENRWAVLYLLRAVSEDQRREGVETRGTATPFTSTLSGPAALGGLQALPKSAEHPKLQVPHSDSPSPSPSPKNSLRNGGIRPSKSQSASSDHGHQGGVLILSKDADNVKSVAIREFVEISQVDLEVTEAALVRDVVYACQGIDGRYVKFDKEQDGYVVDSNVKVPKATRVLVRRLCEVGWLFRRVRNHISESLEDGPLEAIGTVGQAFCAALQEELGDYYRLMAVLETQVYHPIPFMSGGVANNGGNYLSLRRLSVWLAEPLTRMRLMAVLVDDCKTLRGGAMAGAIHMHLQHGDPLVRSFLKRLMRRVCAPIYEMIRRWVLEGEVDDLYGEFFVVAQPVKAEALWRQGYQLQTSMLPSFIPEPLAKRILRTGKSINFLRVCCEDQGWARAAAAAVATVRASANGGGGLGYGETEALESLVVEAAGRIDRHLIQIVYNRYKFRDQCLAIKRYLLLGQGDFIQYLMDLVGPELSLPANTLSAFKLSGTLESAIRASNAQYDDSDILDRLRVKMMPHSDGDRGWDVFSLQYDARDPLTTVFTEDVMARYLRIFNFLWRLKRVEHALSATWQTMKPNCLVARLSAIKGDGVKSELTVVLRRCQTLRNEMNHFVTNLQYYIMFEVLEFSWANFLEEMEVAHDLDELIAAHEKYLGSIVEKALLGERSQLLCKTLFSLFDLILRFRGLADRLFENAREMDARSQNPTKQRAKKDFHIATLSGRKSSMSSLSGDFLATIGEEMDGVAVEYSSLLEGFIAQLPAQQHVDLKFLSFRLDFSEFYTRQHMSMSTTPLKFKRTPLKL
ncbi:gamma-tubulin complex component 3 [Marchantia polymorpha subsp. ruderalis]|uniref:Uncharacterized protein n=2 Tax=Marchantia polymorpha TaxID=3197 RepID=A0A176VK20_MARPO|nr:hypothetical protein AXG93_3818s1140 [Marchantia polymorpha subsp. ruderalis]PTQ50436.1 hypothetical protein MARPO_0001s0406 [Marchantia polymorpha]BBM99355.1 hypothetical protein Mp_1g20710 [Marchantia polymorpha subsp. ruderalis]|eukprot:PTQ50436.1 hypothetical protein MARPO_0001s0406 [Marchantia polymorpha]